MRRKLTALAASSAVLLASGLIAAAPAFAAASPSTLTFTCNGSSLAISPGNNVTASSGDQVSIVNNTGLSLVFSLPTGFTLISGALMLNNNATAVLQVGSLQPSYTQFTALCNSLVGSNNVAWTVTGGGGGGGSSSSSAAAPLETLSLSVAASGATCTGGNPAGYSGSWLTLPSADQCTQSGPTAKPGAKLLGWATSASFPIARAQAQIDKKWGVIDEEIGGVRMIFIPAGMATFVSGSNNLFPIWSA